MTSQGQDQNQPGSSQAASIGGTAARSTTGHGRRPARTVAATDITPATHAPSLARFYMTSDLRAATGLTRTHLDFYLREAVIVPTARTESGYLLFDDGELATLRQVIAWRQSGLGIREIRARLGRAQDGDREKAASASSEGGES